MKELTGEINTLEEKLDETEDKMTTTADNLHLTEKKLDEVGRFRIL